MPKEFIQTHMMAILKTMVTNNFQPIVFFIAAYILIVGLGHRSQIDQWCAANPRLAGVIKIIRGLGIDPWLIWQGLILLVKARLPAYLSKLLPMALLACLIGALGCTMSLEAARTQGIQKRAAAVKASPATTQASDRTECKNIDGIRKTWGYVEISITPVAPLLLGAAAIPGVEGKTQNALLIGGGLFGVAAGFAAAEKHVWTNEWTEQCAATGAP